jgi:uncharacterized protein with FMN-binding domain
LLSLISANSHTLDLLIDKIIVKKTLLSLSVIGSFLLYSFITRRNNFDQVPILPQTEVISPSPQSSPIGQFGNIVGSSLLPSSTANNEPVKAAPSQTTKGLYKDGSFTGSLADAYYGYIQVAGTFKNGRLSDVQFLQYPNDRSRSISINRYAMPILRQEALQVQNTNVDIVSGATDSSQAFIESLNSVFSQAKNI